ncbi:MAG: TraM recognition domain-containing protein [Candidatus Paceibacterota bacterium]
MAESLLSSPEKPFSSPHEEIAFLRSELAKKESLAKASSVERLETEKEVIRAYQEMPATAVIAPERVISTEAAEAIVLKLSPEAHDRKIEELLGILQEKGLKNALTILDKLDNLHLEDDFHRFISEYLRAGYPIAGFEPKSALWRPLHLTLFEILLPEASTEDGKKNLKEQISSMEQLYSGLLAITNDGDSDKNYFSFEIANSNESEESVIYAAVPISKADLFEKQVLSVFPDAKISEKHDDYNIFNEKGVAIGAYADLVKESAFSLKTYENFDYDPLNILLNAFSKIRKSGEGAAVQFLIRSSDDFYIKRYKRAIAKIQEGVKVSEAVVGSKGLGTHFVEFFKGVEKPKKKDDGTPPIIDKQAVDNITAKTSSTIAEVVIRIVVSADTVLRAREILSHLESAFNQLEDTHGNKIQFIEKKGSIQKLLLRNFAFRVFTEDQIMPLNLKELTTLIHLPTTSGKASPQLKQTKAGTAPAPLELSQTGTIIGVNRHRGAETKVFMAKEDRLRHFYTIGQTGTGKSTLLKNMAVQDILNGEGVCVIDPHGSDIQDILATVPPNRYEDVIYFDPAYTARPIALNMLEYDTRFPEQKTFVVNEMMSIFNKLFDMKTAGGPMFEQYFRNATMLVIEDPETGNTLLDVSRVLSNKAFRELKLSRCKNPIVVQFWREIADKAGGEASLANIVPYITSKFDVFLSNEIMRPVIAQEKSSFNFREIMDKKKIMLVNLSKGRLGDINANLIGLILVGKILMAALSRSDSFGQDLPPFYLYIDEFQNITTDSIATILSEARKYKLGLNIAHQFIAQLDEKIQDAVFGNVGSIAAFRVGADDAEYLEKQFAPVFTARDIMNLDNRNAYLKLLVNGKAVKPFSIETLPPARGDLAKVEKLKELSYLTHGKDRAEVEAEIMKKYQKGSI